MKSKRKNSGNLHPKNKHQKGYNLTELCEVNAELKQFVFTNKYGTETIDFANPDAVKNLNRALLMKDYGISYWDFPDDNLCPAIPGRVDYVHHLADLLKADNLNEDAKIIDVGVGANCIYPLLGNAVYGWNFLATDIDKKSIDRASKIVKKNNLSAAISFKLQKDATHIFEGVLDENSRFTATMCNPPFYRSQEEAMQANARKLEGLGTKGNSPTRNFSGKQQELWYKGGEKAFVHTYLYESSKFKEQCVWYTTLVSKKENVESLEASAKKLGVKTFKIIPMHQGNKITRFVAWRF